MQRFRFRGQGNGQRLGKLAPQAVHYLRQSNYDLIARASAGSPAALRAYAGRLRMAHDLLRFRLPPFAAYLQDVAAIAEAEAIKREAARRASPCTRGTRLQWPTHGVAKFSRRGRS